MIITRSILDDLQAYLTDHEFVGILQIGLRQFSSYSLASIIQDLTLYRILLINILTVNIIVAARIF